MRGVAESLTAGEKLESRGLALQRRSISPARAVETSLSLTPFRAVYRYMYMYILYTAARLQGDLLTRDSLIFFSWIFGDGDESLMHREREGRIVAKCFWQFNG